MGKKIQFIGRYALEGHLLGKGSFARVELAHHSVTGCKVAIKIIDTRKVKDEYQKNNIQRESRILGQLRHPNIVRLYETLKASTLHCLVLEYASGGELQAFIKLQKDFRLSEDRGRPYIRQLVSALHYLHERGVAHRDLKMENVMLDTPKINIKLVDFGLSNTFSKDELMKTHCGSPEYAAPELFTAGDKYGLEIDIWSLGIVMYAMLVGKLPFTTPYTDQYRRQKLVQQMEKGLVDSHNQEMSHLSADCQDLLHKIIEPSASLRLPLLDMEIHPWFTENATKPFFPFQSFPRDKVVKTQMEDSMCSLEEEEEEEEEEETYEELATAMSMKKEVLEQKVAENKSDELSAMFNMVLDRKRQQQGLFDVDHTIKSSEKKETKGKRSKSAHTKHDKKHAHKGPPALILPQDDMTAESAPHSGNEPDHETKFSSFDFLALCSTPTWLGPERRKSRRRSRSPMPSPHVLQHGSQGDYLERQAMEMEREIIREERAAAAGLLTPTQDSQHQYNDHHTPVSTSLSVPGASTTTSQYNAFRRSSSFKLSRRRARSCGPSQRRKSFFQRSGSIDHRTSDKGDGSQLSTMLTSTKDGRSAPSISGDAALLRGSTKTASLKFRRRSTSGPHNVTAYRKQSVDFVDRGNNNFLGVPSYDGNKKNLGSSSSLLKVPEVDLDGRNLLQIPSLDMGSNPLLCIPKHNGLNHPIESTPEPPSGSRMQTVTRPGKLTLKEFYPPEKENNKLHPQLLPLIKPLILGANGPLTSVEVHIAGISNPSSSTDLFQPSSHTVQKKDASDILCNDMEILSGSHKLDSLCLDGTDKHGQSKKLIDTRGQKMQQKRSLLETSATSFPPLLRSPPASKSRFLNSSSQLEGEATAMQIEDKSNVLCNSKDNNLFLQAKEPTLIIKDGITDLQHDFSGLILACECMEENEDRVDSMTELISDPFKNKVMDNFKPAITSPVDLRETQKMSRQNSIPTQEDDLVIKASCSLASSSKSSGSSKKPGSGKAKSPTTPAWLNLRTPLARIESFHSDDFECFADSDNDEQGSVSSPSASTPTVPCFAYKFHILKSKQTKLKSSGNSQQSGCGCGSVQHNSYLSSKLNRNTVDKKQASIPSGHARLDAAVTSPLLSSGSEAEHHDEVHERLGAHGKSKIHPMGADDRDAELLSKSDTKYFSYHNTVTRQPNPIKNAINKVVPEVEQGEKKKTLAKHLAWRKSFAQFLKRKRYHSPLVTIPPQHQQIHRHQQPQQNHRQQPSLGNNNNNELVSRDSVIPESQNGISALNHLQMKPMDISTGTDTSLGGDTFKVAVSTLSPVPMENIVTELIELQSSPKPLCPPSPHRAFDFSLAPESPKIKSSCLIRWGTCRDCGKEDISSEEENDHFTTTDPSVTLNLKHIGENNVQGNTKCSQTYALSEL